MTEKSRRTAVALLVVGIVLVSLALAAYVPTGNSRSPLREFVVKEGEGSSKVARLLAEENLINSRYLFMFYLISTGREKDLRAGRYLLSAGMSMVKITRMLVEGRAESDDLEVTIPEGFNVWEIDQRLTEQKLIKAGDFFTRFHDQEGRLFPDTYRLKNQNGEIITALVAKMEENFEKKAGSVTKEQLIMASLLEKEVQKSEEMALVAGIIYKRLELGMLLQIDASVAYGACLEEFKEESLKFKSCDVSQVNLIKWIKIDGSYNAYTRAGLPVGPISNPGVRALEAVRYPQTSDYLYYLTATDGRTVFSKTAEEHERNRKRYLR